MIWLIGNQGMLGKELAGALSAAGLAFVGTDREVSILERGALEEFARGKTFSWIVNCAAYTAVEKAEDEPELAYRLNVEGPENLALTARSLGGKFLHISTDYVFDGMGSKPYMEDDSVAPIGVYGWTKAEGEERVRATIPEHVIVRTAWLYGLHGPNFVYSMLKLMATKDRIGVVADQRGTPTWARDLAAAIVAIICCEEPRYGIFHFTNEGETTWHDFAVEIQRLGLEVGLLDRPCIIDALTTAQYPTKVRRPAYSILSKAKISRVYGLKMTNWEKSLREYLGGVSVILRRQRAWFARADYDLKTAEVDLAAGQYRPALFWCQQGVEKYLKALIEFQDRPKAVHDLPKLAAYLELRTDRETRRLFSDLSQFYRDMRYDIDAAGLDEELTAEFAGKVLAKTKEALEWIRSQNRLPLK
jgi:dTDP-4-dehydrorhamnose reductase